MSDKELNRRTFLRTSLLSGAGAVIAPSLLAKPAGIEAKADDRPFIRRKLGKTGIILPVVSFGVMRADNPALVRAAIKEGIVLFDTAHGYQRGNNEEMLGEVLKDYPRDSFVLATKIKPEGEDRKTGDLGPKFSVSDFLEKLDLSLERLKMNYVDILYAHNVSSPNAVLYPGLIEALTLAKKSGKAKHIGFSTHSNEPEVIRAGIKAKVYEVILTSVNFKQDHYAEVKKAIGEAAEAGIGIVAMKTMAGGFHDKARTQPINCKAALKFVLQDENITTSIPGNSNFDHLAMNASVNFDISLTTEEKADLASPNLQGSLYCQACRQCVSGCVKDLPIPDIMRAYMYTYGYQDSHQAYSLLKSLELPGNPCGDCNKCGAVCAKDFNVSERIADVMRLASVPEEFLS